MNKWLHKFMEKPDKPDNTDKRDGNLENMPGGGPDKPDRLGPNFILSGLSGSAGALLGENLSNMPKIGPDISDNTDKPDISDKPDKPDISDKPDRLGPNFILSGLSGGTRGLFPETEKNGATNELTELTRGHQSGLSVPPQGLFPLDRDSLLYDFEERLAIAEYDGDQTALHAHHIAYLDAFISVLTSLPATDLQRDWLDQRIQTSLAWIEAQGFQTRN